MFYSTKNLDWQAKWLAKTSLVGGTSGVSSHIFWLQFIVWGWKNTVKYLLWIMHPSPVFQSWTHLIAIKLVVKGCYKVPWKAGAVWYGWFEPSGEREAPRTGKRVHSWRGDWLHSTYHGQFQNLWRFRWFQELLSFTW